VIVVAKDVAELQAVIAALEGQLTATLHAVESDHATVAQILPGLVDRVGRVLANGWPTGVEVCHAMVHGGPYPSTSDARTTSVGTLAMDRFLRPVCYQDIPDALLPPALQEANPWALPRKINGVWER
jgi:NADP-dependent aldehyde dehydrogenase